MELSGFPQSNRYYGGTERKVGILIDGVPELNDMQRQFYRHMLRRRFTEILQAPYEQLMGGAR